MFSMNEYLESNDILRVFERYSSCMHYEPKYLHIRGESPDLKKSDPSIIRDIVFQRILVMEKELLKNKYEEHIDNLFFFFSPNYKIDIENDTWTLELKTTNKEIGHGEIVFEGELTISNLLKSWKFI